MLTFALNCQLPENLADDPHQLYPNNKFAAIIARIAMGAVSGVAIIPGRALVKATIRLTTAVLKEAG